MLVLTVFYGEMMEAELFCEFFKIPAGWISNVGPYDIVAYFAKVANVCGDAVLGELLRVAI
jgi:hypothetical protein